MTTRNLDVALRIRADLGEASAALARLDASLDQLAASGRSTAQGLNATAAAADKTSAALKTEAGAADAAARAHSKLTPTVDSSAKALTRGAVSSAQYQQALRQLPMQMTDVVTGLASGQPVFMVAIQQGGQLRDSFGGFGAAARAAAGMVSPLFLVVGAGAAAFALVGKAVLDSYQELQGYERALISTGNVTGTTAGAIADMADRVGETTGQFAGAEQAALALAQSGKLTADMLEKATQAAVDLARLTGNSIENTAEQIIKLAASPSAHLAKLNEQYHFLSASVYDQVRALEKEGHTNEALKLAVDTLADAQRARVEEMIRNMGTLERSALAVKDTFAGIWEGFKEIGRDDPTFNLRVALTRLQAAQSIPAADPARVAAIREAEAAVRAAQAAVDKAKRDAETESAKQHADDAAVAKAREKEAADQKEIEQARERSEQRRIASLTKQQKLEEEILQIRKDGAVLGASDADTEKQVAAARARFAQSLAQAGRASPSDAQRADEAGQRELENLQKQVATLGLLEVGEKRLTEVERIRYEIEQGTFQLASAATQQALLDQAAKVDAANAARAKAEEEKREVDKTRRAYEALKDALRTPAEVHVDAVIERIETLDKALRAGIIDATQHAEQLGRIFSAAAASSPPKIEGLSPEFGIFSSEEDRLARQREQEQARYEQQLAELADFRARKAELQQQANEWELQIEAQHQQALVALARAQQQLAIAETASMFDSMAQIARAFAGEQSSTYKVLFAISKGFAIAQAAVALAQNVAEASKVGFPYNLPLIAGAFAQGAQIAALLSAAQYASGGRIVGPGTGTSDSVPIMASRGEFMVRERAARQAGAYPFLEDFNARGMQAIHDWRGYAEGGVITDREPRAPIAESSARQTSVNNRMRVYLLNNEDELAARLSQHPAMEKAVVAIARQNGHSIRADW